MSSYKDKVFGSRRLWGTATKNRIYQDLYLLPESHWDNFTNETIIHSNWRHETPVLVKPSCFQSAIQGGGVLNRWRDALGVLLLDNEVLGVASRSNKVPGCSHHIGSNISGL